MKDSLHRIHAAPASGKGGNSVDIGLGRWRGDGAPQDLKRATAHRIAVCWNVLEGWRTEDLEAGVLREVDDLARELVAAVMDIHPRSAIAVAEELRAAFERRDLKQDMTDGRPHDCKSCLRTEALPEDAEDE